MAVWGASSVATYLGISELIIGLTVIAIGTSLPELAASVMSALKDTMILHWVILLAPICLISYW